MVERLVDAAVQGVLRPWRRRKAIDKIVADAVDRLPYTAKSYYKPTEWQTTATQLARQAVRQLGDDATMPEVQAAAVEAVDKIGAVFTDAKMRDEIMRWASLPWSLTDGEKESARQAIREAMAKLPMGTPRSQLEAARDHAIQMTVAGHEHRKLCAKIINSIVNEFSREDPKVSRQLQEAMSQVLAQLPVGAAEQVMVKICDEGLRPVRDAIIQRDKKSAVEVRVNRLGVSAVFDYLGTRHDIECSGFDDQWSTARKVWDKIQPILLQELLEAPSMTDQKIASRMEALANEHVDEFLEAQAQ